MVRKPTYQNTKRVHFIFRGKSDQTFSLFIICIVSVERSMVNVCSDTSYDLSSYFAVWFKVHGSFFVVILFKVLLLKKSVPFNRNRVEYKSRRVLDNRQPKHTRNIAQRVIVLLVFLPLFFNARRQFQQSRSYYCGKPLALCISSAKNTA